MTNETELTFLDGQDAPEPILIFKPSPFDIVFRYEGEDVGKFEYDREKRKWSFEGDCDESAKQFVKFIMAHFQSAMDGRDGL